MKPIVYKSRRGDYVVWPEYRELKKSKDELHKYINEFEGIDRIKELCKKEYDLFKEGNLIELKKHPFWEKDTMELLEAYSRLYTNFHKKIKDSKVGSKNVFTCQEETCISSLQLVYDEEGNKELVVFQRSCDLSLGYLADAITLGLFMDEYTINKLCWIIGCPHVYTNNLENTVKQFNEKKKIKMNFNVR